MRPRYIFAAVGLAVLAFAVMSASEMSSQSNSVQYTRIVKRISLTGQVGGVPLTTLFTPSISALYRVSGYSVTTTPDPKTSSNILEDLLWFDGTDSQTARAR